MSTGTIILLGAFAGLTIYLGLPLAFLKNAPQAWKNFASMLATGVLIFLFYDVIGKASEPIGSLIDAVRTKHTGGGALALDIALLVGGLVIGLIGLVYFNKHVIARLKAGKSVSIGSEPIATPAPEPQLVTTGVKADSAASVRPAVGIATYVTSATSATSATVLPSAPSHVEMSPAMLSLIIATGIGLHNFSEGLAIGQSAAIGALQLATVLIIGFGLHNMTEGFGIAGPLAGRSVSWKFIAMLGLIGGGPTFLGTIVGIVFHSPEIFIFCLALAAGAILYVVAELLGVAKRFKSQDIVMWGLLAGFLLGYATDLIVTFAGA